MKQKLSIFLAVVLLLSLFAGCTPADVPSTGDSSVDASVTDSSVSDTSLSETDTTISETNTDVSTDSATSDSVTDTATDSESSQTSSEPEVEKTTLTMEDLRTIVYGVIPRETTFDYLEGVFGKKGSLAVTGPRCYEWVFDNFHFQCFPIRTDTINYFCVIPKFELYYDVESVQAWLSYLGINIDDEPFAFNESINGNSKATVYKYLLSLPGRKLEVIVRYITDISGSLSKNPKPGEPYLHLICFQLPENTD